jgi:hypothetical protein
MFCYDWTKFIQIFFVFEFSIYDYALYARLFISGKPIHPGVMKQFSLFRPIYKLLIKWNVKNMVQELHFLVTGTIDENLH